MATPQENLQAAFPGAQTGDSVYDEGLGIYWYYDGSTWLQYSELPGKIIGPVQNPISPYEFEDKIAPNLNIGINVESFSYRLEPTSETHTLGVTVGGSVRAVSFVFIPSNPFRSRVLVYSFTPSVAISATVFVETVSISLAGLEPGVEGGDAKILFISNPVTIDFNTQLANVETLVRSIEPSAAVINLTINEPQIQAIDDTFFNDVVLLIADNNIEPNTEKPSGRVFIDKSQHAKRLYQTSYVDNYSNYSNGAELVGNHRYIKSVDKDLAAWEVNRPYYLDTWAGFPKVEGHVSEDAFISTDGHQGVRFQDANVNNENGAFAFTSKTNWLETVDYPSHTLDNNDFTIEWWQYLNEGSYSKLLDGAMGATNANELTYAGNGALSGSHETFIGIQSDQLFIGFHAELGSNTLRVKYDTTGIDLTSINLGLVGGESISFYVDDVLVNATISSYVQKEALGVWENTKFVFSDYAFSANYQVHEIRIPLQQTVFSSLRKTEKSRRGVCNVLEFDNDNIYIIRNANNSYSSSKAEENADPFWDDVVCLFDFNSVSFTRAPVDGVNIFWDQPRESFVSLKHYNGNKFILASKTYTSPEDTIGSVFRKEEGITGGAYISRWPYYKDLVKMDTWPPVNWWSESSSGTTRYWFNRSYPRYQLLDPKVGSDADTQQIYSYDFLNFTNVNQGLTVEFYFKFDFWFDEWNQNGWTRPGNTGIDTRTLLDLNRRNAFFMECNLNFETGFYFGYENGIGWRFKTKRADGGNLAWVNGDNSVVTPDDNIIEWEKWHLYTVQFYPGNPLYVDVWVDGKFIGRNEHPYGALQRILQLELGPGDYGSNGNTIEEGVSIDSLRFTANLRYEPQQDFTPPSYPFPARGGDDAPKEDNEIEIPVSNAIGQTPFLEKTWQHVAVTRSGNDIKAFVDGIEVGNANPDQLFPITYPDNTSYWLATTSLLTIYKFDISALNITPAIDTLSLGDVLTAKVDGIFIASGTLSSLTVNGDYFEITTTSNTLEAALAATSRGVLEFADLGIQTSVSAIGTGHLYYRGYKDYRASTFNGFMESFRTTLAARYTTAFTPPNTFPGLVNSVSYETQNALEPSDPFDIVLEVTGAIDGAGDFIDTSPNAHVLIARDSSVNVPASVSRWSLYTLMDVDTVTTISGLYYVCVFDTIDTSVGRWQWSYNAEGMHANYLDGAFRTLVLEKRSDAEAPFANGTTNPFLDSLDLDVPGSFWARFEDAPNEWVRIDYKFIRRETRSYENLDNVLYTDTGYETFTFVECLEGETSYDRFRNAVYNATGTWVDEPSVNSWIDVTSVNPITTPADGGISPCMVADHPLGVVPAIRLNPGHWLQVTSPDPSLTLGQQPFTIEYWIKVENHPEAISPGNVGFFPLDVTSNPNSSPRLYVDWDEPINNAYVGSRLGKYVDAQYEGNMAHWSPVKGRSFTISDNFHAFGNEMRRKRWYHIAYTRDLNGDVRLFVNGKLSDSPQTSIDFASRRSGSTNNRTVIGIKNFTQPLDVIGTTWLNNVNPQELRGLDGYITDIRIINGQALYIEDFDPPLQTLIEADRPDDGILLTSQEVVAFKLKTYMPRVNSDLIYISVDDPVSLTVQNFYSDENGFTVIVNPALRYQNPITGDFEFNLVLYLASGINSISATDPQASLAIVDAGNQPIGALKELSDGTNGIKVAVWSYKGDLAQDSNGDYTLNYFAPVINLNWGLHRGIEFDWDRREVDYGEFPDSYSEIVPFSVFYNNTLYNTVAPYTVFAGARGGYSHRIAHWAGGCSWTQSNGFNAHLSDSVYSVSEGELWGNTISTDAASEASWDAYFGPEKQNVYFGSILRADRTWDLNTGNTHPFVRVPSAPGACYGGVRQFSFARSLYGINRPYFDDVSLVTPTGYIPTSADPLAVNIARNWCWVDPLYYGLNTSPNYYPVYTHPTLGDINQDVLHRTGLVDSQNIPFDFWGGHRWGWKGIKARGVTNEFHGTHVTRNTDHVIEMRFAIPKTTIDDVTRKRTFRNNAPFDQRCTTTSSPPNNNWCYWNAQLGNVYSEPLNKHTSDESDGFPLSTQPVSKPSAGITLNYFGRGTYSIHNQYVEHGDPSEPLTRLPSIACPGSDDQSDVFTVTGPNGLSHPLMGMGLPSWAVSSGRPPH